MKKFTLFVFAASLALPAGAQAQQRLSEEQLIAYATEQGACEDRVVASARYVNETENRVQVTCEDAEGFVPLAAGLGLGGAGAAAAAVVGVAAAAAAAGGGGATPDTQ
jgi:hypothetical protein